ncbi:MAG: metallophosphoesterase [Phycisphaerales bacterium]|nr:metallophosphoesterase [Phycisphaerales bacterium]
MRNDSEDAMGSNSRKAVGWCWGIAAMLLGVVVVWAMELPPSPSSFIDLPAATQQSLQSQGEGDALSPGTDGLPLPRCRKALGSRTIVILGDLSPTNAASTQYVKDAVRQVNLLSPDAVFTVGNLVNGLTRSGQEYARQVMAVRGELDRLNMPWYPCVGRRDVMSGERSSGQGAAEDRRCEELYKNYFGPLYYSAQCGGVHVIVLNSEEGLGKGDTIRDGQLEWLKEDLKGAFELGRKTGERRTEQVVVMVHRPLWREKKSNWSKVHDLLVAFNRKPIVHVEGMGDAVWGGGPKVVAVYAGGTQAYADDGLLDGIQYTVMGATAARIKQDAATEVRGFALVKFDATETQNDAAMHASIIEMGMERGMIVAADVITASERAVLGKIQAIPNDVLGVVGVLEPGAKKNGGGGN